MKIAIVTNLDERCGNAEYGRNLCRELGKYFTVEAMNTFPESGYDLILVNWHPPVVQFTMADIQIAKARGTKIILLTQESSPGPHACCRAEDIVYTVDAVVAHEDVLYSSGLGIVNFKMIPHGIVEVADLPDHISNGEPKLGTAGFCFAGKNMDVTVNAANSLSGKALLIAPGHPWCEGGNAQPLWDKFRAMSSKLELVTDFLPEPEVVKKLATCDINIYVAQDSGPGQSGSARLVIAARRPTIVIRDRKTSALYGYEDELYFVTAPNEVTGVAYQIWSAIQRGEPVKRPNRVIRDCCWSRVGEMYRELALDLCGVPVER